MSTRKHIGVLADRCIGCGTCMAGCIQSHRKVGKPAFPRISVASTFSLSAPVSCKHCEDPYCVSVCPTGCLYRDGNRIGINDAKCIGCSSCVMACPYGAISVVNTPRIVSYGDLHLQVGEAPVAVKCDLCVDRGGQPACVEACPTKGLYLDEIEVQ